MSAERKRGNGGPGVAAALGIVDPAGRVRVPRLAQRDRLRQALNLMCSSWPVRRGWTAHDVAVVKAALRRKLAERRE